MKKTPLHKTACVTGGSRGLGLSIAEEFHRNGWHVALVARKAPELEAAAAHLNSLPGKGDVFTLPLDLQDPRAPEQCCSALRTYWDGLGALINNAGVQGPIGPLWTCEPDAWEGLFRVLLFAPMALCRCVIPWMQETGGGSIVNISGGGATAPRPNFSAYAAAKTGLVRLTETLAVECKPLGITINAVAPGALPTAMLREVMAAGMERAGTKEIETAQHVTAGGDEAIQRAARCVFSLAGGAPVTGKLISAVWDPWEDLGSHQDDLSSDIYTLRRITPKDRGKTWGNDL